MVLLRFRFSACFGLGILVSILLFWDFRIKESKIIGIGNPFVKVKKIDIIRKKKMIRTLLKTKLSFRKNSLAL